MSRLDTSKENPRAYERRTAGLGPHRSSGPEHEARHPPLYAALDLGTNNCRLLFARPSGSGLRVVEAFSRIVRLGEGISRSNQLSETAIRRTIEALKVCAERMAARPLERSRLIATEACRSASNGEAFLTRVRDETGLQLEIVDRETEAQLAAAGCLELADPADDGVVLFDIGGGSSEIVWLDRDESGERDVKSRMRAWISIPWGVVTLSERHGGIEVTRDIYKSMVDEVRSHLSEFAATLSAQQQARRYHLLGTSGTVTTLGGVHLGLRRYERRRIDGLWSHFGDDRQSGRHDLPATGRPSLYRSSTGGSCSGRLCYSGCDQSTFPVRAVADRRSWFEGRLIDRNDESRRCVA